MGRDVGKDIGRDTGRVKREAGGRGGEEAVEKSSLGKQCLSFDILFLATPFLLLPPFPTFYFSFNSTRVFSARVSTRVSACVSTYISAHASLI